MAQTRSRRRRASSAVATPVKRVETRRFWIGTSIAISGILVSIGIWRLTPQTLVQVNPAVIEPLPTAIPTEKAPAQSSPIKKIPFKRLVPATDRTPITMASGIESITKMRSPVMRAPMTPELPAPLKRADRGILAVENRKRGPDTSPPGNNDTSVAINNPPIAPDQHSNFCLPGMCPFSISGKRGRFIATSVRPELLAAKHAAIAGTGNLALSEASGASNFAGMGLWMPQTQRSLEAMLTTLRGKWPYHDPGPIRITIVGTADYSAASTPDRTIVVPFGLLQRAKSDDEVAWVIAHEFSHIALGHVRRQASRPSLSPSFWNAIHPTLMADESSRSSSLPIRVDQLRTFIELNVASFSRNQEDQADVLALDLILAAGFSPMGANSAFDNIDIDDLSATSSLAALNSELLARKKIISESYPANNPNNENNIKSFIAEYSADITTLFSKYLEDRLKMSHRPTVKRRAGINTYFKNAYDTPLPKNERVMWLSDVRITPEFKEAVIAIDAREGAIRELSHAFIDAADERKSARSADDILHHAFSTRFRDTPLILNLAARIKVLLGDDASAQRLYDLADRATATREGSTSPDIFFSQSIDGYRDHIALLIRDGRFEAALDLLKVADQRIANDALLPSRINIYAQSGRSADLISSIQRCLDSETPGVATQCKIALLSDAKTIATAAATSQGRMLLEEQRASATQQPHAKALIEQLPRSHDE